MTAQSMTPAAPSLGDRYAPLSVIVVTLVALLVGWGLKSQAQNRAVEFSNQGVSARVPAGWKQSQPEGSSVLLRARDPLGIETAYIIEAIPSSDGSLPAAVSVLSLERGQSWPAYRILEQTPVTVDGREAFKVSFVFVDTDPNVADDHLPVVVRGVDYLYAYGDRVVVVTLTAQEGEFDGALPRFRQFLKSVTAS